MLNKTVTLIFHNFHNELLLQKTGRFWIFPTTNIQENEKLTDACRRLAQEEIGAVLLSSELKFLQFLTSNGLISYFFYCANCECVPSRMAENLKFIKFVKISRLEIDIQHKQILPLVNRYIHE